MPRTWDYPSKSSSAVYTVTLADNGVLACTCRGWVFRRGDKPRQCTHTLDVIKTNGYEVEVRGEYVFVVTTNGDENGRKGLTPAANDSIIDVEGRESAPMTGASAGDDMTTTTTATTVEGMKACAMVEGKHGHIVDEDGYIIPEKFDAAFNNGEWVMEEKLDGHRVQIQKRGDEIITDLRSIPSLPEQIVASMRKLPDGIYDGEILVRIPGAVSTDVPNLKYRHLLYFAIFDLIEVCGNPTVHLTQVERRGLLEAAVPGDNNVCLVASFPAKWENVLAIWQMDGEGTILKKKSSPYRMGYRSAEWLKVKSLEHHTAVCTGFEAGSLGPTAIVLGKLDDGTPVRCKNKNNAELAATSANPEVYIGQRFVIQCQKRTRGTKHLRHPMFDHWAGEGE